MALKKLMQMQGESFVNTQFGQINAGQQTVEFEAYCKITDIHCNKVNGQVTLECCNENIKITQKFNVLFSVQDGSENFIKQAYLHLKTLPEFENAVDC